MHRTADLYPRTFFSLVDYPSDSLAPFLSPPLQPRSTVTLYTPPRAPDGYRPLAKTAFVPKARHSVRVVLANVLAATGSPWPYPRSPWIAPILLQRSGVRVATTFVIWRAAMGWVGGWQSLGSEAEMAAARAASLGFR